MTEVSGKVLKHRSSTRLMHWVNLLCFITLGVTGMGFYFHSAAINNLFGGPANASIVHRVTAVVFTLNPLIYILVNYRSFAKFIDTITTFTRDDFNWLKVMGGYLPFLKTDHLPPQDKYNAGQKILGNLVILGSILFIITGFPMWLGRHSLAPLVINWFYTIHLWDAIIMILAVIGHFILAAVLPASRVEFNSMMVDGLVDAEFSAHHNAKWFAELDKLSVERTRRIPNREDLRDLSMALEKVE